jgi:hypothetical protein
MSVRQRESPVTALLKQREPITEEQLAAVFTEWRQGATTLHLSKRLGVPERTINRIEAGKYFRYPRLLLLAMHDLKPHGKWR